MAIPTPGPTPVPPSMVLTRMSLSAKTEQERVELRLLARRVAAFEVAVLSLHDPKQPCPLCRAQGPHRETCKLGQAVDALRR